MFTNHCLKGTGLMIGKELTILNAQLVYTEQNIQNKRKSILYHLGYFWLQITRQEALRQGGFRVY